jgi:MarR family transcriptional regulator, organic hydroperoxide resistance regulator
MSRIAKRERPVSLDGLSSEPMELGPALDFMRSMWRLNHALELTSGHMERAMGITAQQRMVIRCLGKQPGISPSQLAALLHLDRSTISTALNRMERAGLLVRRTDKHDRRSVTLWLSAKGKRLDRPSEETVESAVERMLAQIGRRDLVAAARVMGCLSQELEFLVGRDG